MIFDSGRTYSRRAYRDVIAAAHSHRIPVVLARRGMRWTSNDGVTLDILALSLPFLVDTGDDVNDNSIVVMLRYRRFHELFTDATRSRVQPRHDESIPTTLFVTMNAQAIGSA
jgi:beta-lactamase superfamily II metal-dependent hydrolase